MHKKLTLLLIALINLVVVAQHPVDTLNQTDENGLKQGSWKRFNERGVLLFEGQFIDDQPYGEFRYYYATRSLRTVLVYDSAGIEAEAVFRHPNGRIQSEGTYINQKKEGLWKFYDEMGRLVSEEEYQNDLKHGLSRKYFRDGTLLEEQFFVEGTAHGSWKQYHPGGSIKHKLNFNQGLLEGDAVYYNAAGGVFARGKYRNGLKDGEWVRFNQNGVIEKKEDWQMGKLIED
jgi:antitoxin component YwqK of YwqJK toxin-antitoxin module